ncbi:MAG: TRAP transporter small permease, partial [Clostridia bacterium]|nr:TRAP transporter small permease [Clostridia bacterium]
MNLTATALCRRRNPSTAIRISRRCGATDWWTPFARSSTDTPPEKRGAAARIKQRRGFAPCFHAGFPARRTPGLAPATQYGESRQNHASPERRIFFVNKKNPVLRLLLNLDTVLSCIALVGLVAVTFSGAIMRYAFNSPFAWQEEVQLMLIVWIVFLGGRYAFVAGNHCAIDVLVELFPLKVQRYMSLVILTLTLLALGYTTWQSCAYILQMVETGRVTNMLHIPFALVYAPIPIGCLLMMLEFSLQTIRQFHQ